MRTFVDVPASPPQMHYGTYARALAEVLLAADPPQLTLGIFGAYGSGKTTLMRAIEQELRGTMNAQPPLVIARFEAWRFDREHDLLIPFLMSVRQATSAYGDKSWGQEAWTRITNTCRALAYGFSFEFAGISWEAEKSLKQETELYRDFAAQFSSIYTDVFTYLRGLTVADKVDSQPEVLRRIVVFIDDLDRCVPRKALDLLEGIKALLDIPGFLFVLGLDHRVIDQYLKSKYGKSFCVEPEEYLEKLVQVAFRVPEPPPEDLEGVLDELSRNLPRDTFVSVQHAHAFLPRNVRQIKQLLNIHQVLVRVIDDRLLNHTLP